MKNKIYPYYNMIEPGLNLSEACSKRALKMLPNFAISKSYVSDGSTGSCFTNARLMMLACYNIKHGTEALLNYDNSKKFSKNISEETQLANMQLIAYVNDYINICEYFPTDVNEAKLIYCQLASLLNTGNVTICNEANDHTFFKIIQYNKSQLTDDDYRSIINKEIKGTFNSFLIIISGHYYGDFFYGEHETFLYYNRGKWILFDDLDCVSRNIYTGRYIQPNR